MDIEKLKLDTALRRMVSKLSEKERRVLEKIVEGLILFFKTCPDPIQREKLSNEFADVIDNLTGEEDNKR